MPLAKKQTHAMFCSLLQKFSPFSTLCYKKSPVRRPSRHLFCRRLVFVPPQCRSDDRPAAVFNTPSRVGYHPAYCRGIVYIALSAGGTQSSYIFRGSKHICDTHVSFETNLRPIPTLHLQHNNLSSERQLPVPTNKKQTKTKSQSNQSV